MRCTTLLAMLAITAVAALARGQHAHDDAFDEHPFLPPRGEHVATLEALRAYDSDWSWTESAREPIAIDAVMLTLLSLSHPGDAAAIAVLRAEPTGFTVVGTYDVLHGGLGAEITIARRCRSPAGATALALRIQRTSRGYNLTPGSGGCPVQPLADHPSEREVQRYERLCHVPVAISVSWAAIAFDATAMWLVHAETDGPPPRSALRHAPPGCLALTPVAAAGGAR